MCPHLDYPIGSGFHDSLKLEYSASEDGLLRIVYIVLEYCSNSVKMQFHWIDMIFGSI